MRQSGKVIGAVCLVTIIGFIQTHHLVINVSEEQKRHQDQPLSSPITRRSKNIVLPAYNKTNKPSRIVWQTWVTSELHQEARENIAEMENANSDYEFR